MDEEVVALNHNLLDRADDKPFITLMFVKKNLYPKYRCNRLTAEQAGGAYNNQYNYCWAWRKE